MKVLAQIKPSLHNSTGLQKAFLPLYAVKLLLFLNVLYSQEFSGFLRIGA